MQFYVSNLFHLLFPILLTDDLHRVELSIGAFGRGIFTFWKHSILLLFLLIRMNWARGRVDPRKRCSSVASKIWKEVEVCSFPLTVSSLPIFTPIHYRQRYFCLLLVVFDQL